MVDLLSSLADNLGDFVADNGILAAFGLLFIEEAGVPLLVPGDVWVMYVGHRVAAGDIEWWVALITFVATVTLGASVLFLLARRGGERLLAAVRRPLHLTDSNLARAEGWFQRYGPLAIIFGRHIPGLRIPVTVAAGIFRVRYPVFAISVAISTAIWAGAFLVVGAVLGDRAKELLRPHRAVYLVVGLFLVGFVGGLYLWRRRNRLAEERAMTRLRT